jgi:hypothetical protein
MRGEESPTMHDKTGISTAEDAGLISAFRQMGPPLDLMMAPRFFYGMSFSSTLD